MFWSKPKVTFHCKLPEVLERYPIVPAGSLRHNWWRQSALEYKRKVEQIGHREHVAGTVKCPGIVNIMQRGWILNSWFDLTILTGSESDRFEFAIPPALQEYLKESQYTPKLLSWFSENEPALKVPVQDNSLKTLIKINTPWTMSVPKGLNVLMMPIPYSDHKDFSAQPGILNPGKYYDVSPIIEIHKKPGELFIPAGTPLMQIIVLEDTESEITQQAQTKQNWLDGLKSRFRTTHTFTTRDHNDN